MKYSPDVLFIAIIKDKNVIAVMDADKTAYFKAGYEEAGGDTDDLGFTEITLITTAE